MKTNEAVRIVICMGSSCYARGNGDNLRLIEDYIETHGLDAVVDLAGSRCEGRCADGPNIVVDGQLHGAVDESRLRGVLDGIVAGRKGGM